MLQERYKLLPLFLNILVWVLSLPCSNGSQKHSIRSASPGGSYLLCGVPVVKNTLCHVKDGPAIAHIWVSPKTHLCPHLEQKLSSSPVLLYTETCKIGGRQVLERHTFRYWDSLEKCPLWLLLPSAQIHLDQLLVVYPFIDLVTLQLLYRTFGGYWQESPSPATSSPWYVMAFGADLPQVVGQEACEPMHLFGAEPLMCKYMLISMALFFQ